MYENQKFDGNNTECCSDKGVVVTRGCRNAATFVTGTHQASALWLGIGLGSCLRMVVEGERCNGCRVA